MKRDLTLKWIDKILLCDLNQKIYIPAATRSDSQKEVANFKKELEILYNLEPEKAGSVKVAYTFKDRRHWIVLGRVLGNPLVGFLKNSDGTLEKVEIQLDSERDRRIKLMAEDGLQRHEVEKIEGELTEIEKELFDE